MPRVRKVPQRQCVACGRTRGKRDLVRVVRTPTGDVHVDATGRLAGRGAYVCPEADCVERAVRGGRLAGVLEQPLPEGLLDALREAAVRDEAPRAPVVRRVSLRQVQEAGRAEPGTTGTPRSGAHTPIGLNRRETEGSS
ncbi:MAG TPA: YlxR family protein [bacterium]|nr:YlxR family protein [bacterium]